MTGARFAAWLSDGQPFGVEAPEAFTRYAQCSGLEVVKASPRVIVAAEPGCAASDGKLILVGEAHAHDGPQLLQPSEALAALGSEARLPDAFARIWGSYVLLDDGQPDRDWHVGKSPFGTLPCLWVHQAGRVVCASSPALLEAFGVSRPSVDWRETLLYLIATELRRGTTCLEGVRELPGGHALGLRGGLPGATPLWSPWSFARGLMPLTDPDAAAAELGAAIDLAVAARTAKAPRCVLLLSGGLDSSVAAAALAGAGRSFAALNLVTREKSGDERVYARAVAEHTGAPLTEIMRSTEAVDWTDTAPSRLPRPSARIFRQPGLGAARNLAEATGASLVLDGGGGDNVFCSLQSVAPALDRLSLEGPRAAWSTARDIALLCDADLVTVVREVVRRRLGRRVRFRWLVDHSFLAPEARELSAQAVAHPWLDPPPGALPGQAAHVALALAAASVAESFGNEDPIPVASPLVSQPVVETALRVRSWLWIANGRNRAVVRRAFSDRLPEAVVMRQGKGTPAGFMAEIVAHERERLRAFLLDGLLVRNGAADRAALEAYLARTGPPLDYGFARVLQLADAERWARSWV